ncbi:hypothetical protein GPJ56_007085 [Histomonas meleagridis]|uniref:uncharacterized protein n=1 Tax=Histomonas meleagridis TaxID=135588 RepID=UPI00355A6086|nr:hypothetical protein GPJ56_007085 [Histomonas meleagridis]KAH0799798.1 hypothetical protein GO595_007519 [Histomonas meleagridis]
MEETTQERNVFKNMQHAIVEAMNTLGQSSPYGDNSVRMKELFAHVEKVPILLNGKVEEGPHRFSTFNSALCGRRSAAELFERVDDPNRQGAWWRLKMPYEEALDFAVEQKGFRKLQTRVRQKSDTRQNKVSNQNKSIVTNSWKKTKIIEISDRIKEFAAKTFELHKENQFLQEKLSALTDDVTQLKQIVPKETKKMLEIYLRNEEQMNQLKNQVENAQKTLFELSEQAIQLQS